MLFIMLFVFSLVRLMYSSRSLTGDFIPFTIKRMYCGSWLSERWTSYDMPLCITITRSRTVKIFWHLAFSILMSVWS